MLCPRELSDQTFVLVLSWTPQANPQVLAATSPSERSQEVGEEKLRAERTRVSRERRGTMSLVCSQEIFVTCLIGAGHYNV